MIIKMMMLMMMMVMMIKQEFSLGEIERLYKNLVRAKRQLEARIAAEKGSVSKEPPTCPTLLLLSLSSSSSFEDNVKVISYDD